MEIEEDIEKAEFFLAIWTREYVDAVLQEYLNSGAVFLCNGSRKFKSLWEDHLQRLQKLADNFLFDSQRGDIEVDRAHLLPSAGNFVEDRKNRIAFLEYEINRLKAV